MGKEKEERQPRSGAEVRSFVLEKICWQLEKVWSTVGTNGDAP